MFSRWPACIQRPWLLTAFVPDALEGPRLILLGAPASGKGRQSELLVSSFELTHISTGAVLREVPTADRVHPLWLSYPLLLERPPSRRRLSPRRSPLPFKPVSLSPMTPPSRPLQKG